LAVTSASISAGVWIAKINGWQQQEKKNIHLLLLIWIVYSDKIKSARNNEKILKSVSSQLTVLWLTIDRHNIQVALVEQSAQVSKLKVVESSCEMSYRRHLPSHIALMTPLVALRTVLSVGVTNILRGSGSLAIDIISGDWAIRASAATVIIWMPLMRQLTAAGDTYVQRSNGVNRQDIGLKSA
jgi:hypothetical protein